MLVIRQTDFDPNNYVGFMNTYFHLTANTDKGNGIFKRRFLVGHLIFYFFGVVEEENCRYYT